MPPTIDVKRLFKLRLVVARRGGGLHAGGEEQGESRASRPAGIHLAAGFMEAGAMGHWPLPALFSNR